VKSLDYLHEGKAINNRFFNVMNNYKMRYNGITPKPEKIRLEIRHKSNKDDKQLLESFVTFYAGTSIVFIFKAGHDMSPKALLCFN